jgi:hypothetical protein
MWRCCGNGFSHLARSFPLPRVEFGVGAGFPVPLDPNPGQRDILRSPRGDSAGGGTMVSRSAIGLPIPAATHPQERVRHSRPEPRSIALPPIVPG